MFFLHSAELLLRPGDLGQKTLPASGIDEVDDTILFASAHNFQDGDGVKYAPVGVTTVGGLDFRKSISLPPDRCSRLFYTLHRNLLKKWIAGSEEPDLSKYQSFISEN